MNDDRIEQYVQRRVNLAAPSGGIATPVYAPTATAPAATPGSAMPAVPAQVPAVAPANQPTTTLMASAMTNWHSTIVAFVQAHGKTRVAAEAMGLGHELYVLELTQHMDQLVAAIRAITLIDSFTLAKLTKDLLALNLDDLKGEELVKLYTQTLTQIERMTAGQAAPATNNSFTFNNVKTEVIQSLPPEAQAALMKMREAKPEVLEHLSIPMPYVTDEDGNAA